MSKHIKALFFPALLTVGIFALSQFALAANPGTITNGSGTSYAQFSEDDAGAVNFAPDGTSVSVSSSAITGYAWGDVVGWINMNPTNSGVVNDGNGNLSGYAWGEIAGWINFDPTNGGVAINTANGQFSGYAWSENVGWLRFECPGSACVVTSWRPDGTTPPAEEEDEEEEVGGGGGGSLPRDNEEDTDVPAASPQDASIIEEIVPTIIPITTPAVVPGVPVEKPTQIYTLEKPLVFPRNLTKNISGNDVQALQEFLINRGFLSEGLNTGYFGPLTQAALAQYQSSREISPAVGFLGPITRAAIEADMIQAARALRPTSVVQPVAPLPAPPFVLQESVFRMNLISPIPSYLPGFVHIPEQKQWVYTVSPVGVPDILSTIINNTQTDKIESPAKKVVPLVQVVPKIIDTVSKAIGSFFSGFGK